MESKEDFSHLPKWDTNESSSYGRQNSIVRMYNNDAIHDGKEVLPLFNSEGTRINDFPKRPQDFGNMRAELRERLFLELGTVPETARSLGEVDGIKTLKLSAGWLQGEDQWTKNYAGLMI